MTVLRVNGQAHRLDCDPDTPLAYALRELGLKGTKIGCALEQCGACAVLADGEVVLSCVRDVASFDGVEITTVEGLADTETGAKVQEAFVQATAAQCGYCTAGMVIAVTGLLSTNPSPTREEAQEALQQHLCRCGAHPRILRAVEIASGQAT